MNQPHSGSQSAHQQRLLQALAQCLDAQPYREVTLAHIAAAAKVSRRTFYEHFQDKDSCLLALCAQTSETIMRKVTEVLSENDDWPSTVRKVTQAYLRYIGEQPNLIRALYIELAALGQRGFSLRQQVTKDFATLLQLRTEYHQQRGDVLTGVDSALGIAIVAGINELILQALMQDKSNIQQLQETAAELIHRITAANQ